MNTKTFLINLTICFLLSFLIGIERQYRRRVVGLRTTILVCLGSFLFVSASFIVGGARTDLTRIAAGVVSGIGFLGAGVILKEGRHIRGLTTAATMWCDASIGVLCGIGASIPAIFGTFVILFSNTVLRHINKIINNVSSKKSISEEYMVEIDADNKNILNIKDYIDDYLNKYNSSLIDLNNIDVDLSSKKSTIKILLTVKKSHIEIFDNMIKHISESFQMQKIEYHLEKTTVKDEEEIM